MCNRRKSCLSNIRLPQLCAVHIKNTIPSRCSQTPIMHVIATLIRIHSHILPLVSSYIHPSCFSVNCFVSSGIIFSSRPVLPTSSIHFQTTSLRIVLVNLICHDHHPPH